MSPITRTFTRDQLDTLGLPDDIVSAAYAAEHPEYVAAHPGAAIELHREQVDTRRWVSVHELVFRAPDDGKAYRLDYEQGLTEQQDGTDPWNYEDSVTATLVEQYEATVTQWRDVDPDRAEEQRPSLWPWADALPEPTAAEEQQTWTLSRAHLDPFLRSLVSELDYDLHKSWERNEETGEDDYPTLVNQAAGMLDAITAAEERPAALSDSVRQFLTFALDQAAEEMSLRDGFTADDEAALAILRRIADGAPVPFTEAELAAAAADVATLDAEFPDEPAAPFTEGRAAFMQIGHTPSLQGLRAELRIEGFPPLIGRYAGAGMRRADKHEHLLLIEPTLVFEHEQPEPAPVEEQGR